MEKKWIKAALTIGLWILLWPVQAIQQNVFVSKVEPIVRKRASLSGRDVAIKNSQASEQSLISLNFQEIEVRAVLQHIADLVGFNLVMREGVSGKMTIHLSDIPWQEALEIILKTQSLDKRQIGQVYYIDKAIVFAELEKQQLKSQQEVTKLEPLISELIQVNYAKALDIAAMLKDKNNSLLTERGRLSVDNRTNTIWLRDTRSQVKEVKSLVQKLDIPVQQVLIEARIVNMSKHCARDLGVEFGVSRASHLAGQLEGANALANGQAINQLPLKRRLNVDLSAMPVSASPASIGIALAKLGDDILLDLELSALESEGKAEIVASPRLMTTNQQAAMIESGEDIPYQESTFRGATAVAFKKAVLSLKVIPQITPNGKLLLDLHITQDSDSGRRVHGVPILLRKSIETNVLVKHGQTIVLGGIYRRDKANSIARVPFFGKLPGVGHLFSRTQEQISNEELLIFLTPRIIAENFSKGWEAQINQFNKESIDKFGKKDFESRVVSTN